MGLFATIVLVIARAVLSEAAAKMLEGWLRPKPAPDGYREIRKADQAAAKAGKEPTDNDPNRLPPNR